MANLKGKMKKLQTALIQRGCIIKIDQLQFFSDDQQRMITMYNVSTPEYVKNKKGKMVKKYVTLKKSCSMPEIVKFLAEKYRQVSSG